MECCSLGPPAVGALRRRREAARRPPQPLDAVVDSATNHPRPTDGSDDDRRRTCGAGTGRPGGPDGHVRGVGVAAVGRHATRAPARPVHRHHGRRDRAPRTGHPRHLAVAAAVPPCSASPSRWRCCSRARSATWPTRSPSASVSWSGGAWWATVGYGVLNLGTVGLALVLVLTGTLPDGAPIVLGSALLWFGEVALLVLHRHAFHVPLHRRVPGGVAATEGDSGARARTLLTTVGGSTMSWMTTWPEMRYYFTADGRGYVGYERQAGVALALADPVVPEDTIAEAVAEWGDGARGGSSDAGFPLRPAAGADRVRRRGGPHAAGGRGRAAGRAGGSSCSPPPATRSGSRRSPPRWASGWPARSPRSANTCRCPRPRPPGRRRRRSTPTRCSRSAAARPSGRPRPSR